MIVGRGGRGQAGVAGSASVFLLVVSGCAAPPPQTPPPATTSRDSSARALVEAVLDGDTLDARLPEGQLVRVRLLGIDAPEVAGRGTPSACGADAAREQLRRLAGGRSVVLVGDARSDRVDRFGRRLAYVEVDRADVGRRLVANGYAGAWAPASAAKPTRVTEYQRLERGARRQRLGSWATCPRLGR